MVSIHPATNNNNYCYFKKSKLSSHYAIFGRYILQSSDYIDRELRWVWLYNINVYNVLYRLIFDNNTMNEKIKQNTERNNKK